MSMIDISGKDVMKRKALAEGFIKLGGESINAIQSGSVKKGDVLAVSEIAALNAVKKTADLIPHCHPIPIENIDISFKILEDGVKASCEVTATAKTGVEMEALIGVSTALLNIWDMVKYLEKDGKGQYPRTRIEEIEVIKKIKDEP